MLARRLLSRRRASPVEDPVIPGEVTHLKVTLSTALGTNGFSFQKVAKVGSPTATGIRAGELEPRNQLPRASRTTGTITLMGYDLPSGDVPPDFGSTVRRSAVFRCSSAGMEDEPIAVGHALANANSNTAWYIPWHMSALVDPGLAAPQSSYATLNLATGAAGVLSTPNTGTLSKWSNLGHAALLMPRYNIGTTNIPSFEERQPGISIATNFTQSLGPLDLRYFSITAQPARNSKQYFYVAHDHATISEHEIDIDVDYPDFSGMTLVHRTKQFVTAADDVSRWTSIRDGIKYAIAKVYICEIWRGPLGAPRIHRRTSSDYNSKVYPCTFKQRLIRVVGLLRLHSNGSTGFTKWSDGYSLREMDVCYFAGEVTRPTDGLAFNNPKNWYYPATGATSGNVVSSWVDWAAVAGASANPSTMLLDLHADPTTTDSVSVVHALSDRLMAANGLAGVIRFWSFDGTWMSDVPFPVSGIGTVLIGDDVIYVGDRYSRDLGATWAVEAAGAASTAALVPARLF